METQFKNVERLLQMIHQAFDGVVLGNGVSLRQTTVLDNYGSEAELHAARLLDEKEDWRKLIDDPELTKAFCLGGICFFDKEGLIFHLPAYLSLAVKKPFEDVVSSLIFSCCNGRFDDFLLLNESQRRCVYEVLLYLRGLDELLNEDKELAQALDHYWSPDKTYSERQQFAKKHR